MLKLLKYEFRKTWMTKIVLLVLCAVLEAFFVINLKAQKTSTTAALAMLLFVLAIGGTVVIGLQSLLTLHRDMNTRQSYMLFMTPHSSYAILGAKVLECALSLLATGLFFLALGALDVTMMFKEYDMLDQLMDQLKYFLGVLDDRFTLDFGMCASFLFSVGAGWLCVISCAFFADVVSSALLNGKKFNGVISFVLFVAISYAISWITARVPMPVDFAQQLLVNGAVSLGFTAVMYVATAAIMDRKLSV